MVETDAHDGRNVIDFLGYQQGRKSSATGRAKPLAARHCMHCGAALLDGESADDCSSAGISLEVVTRKFYAD